MITRELVIAEIFLTFASQVALVAIYASRARWWTTRIGRGFMYMSFSFMLLLGTYCFQFAFRVAFPLEVHFLLWAFFIFCINFGVIRNMLRVLKQNKSKLSDRI